MTGVLLLLAAACLLASIVLGLRCGRVSNVVRRFQHGRLQSYILYLEVGLAALGFFVFIGEIK